MNRGLPDSVDRILTGTCRGCGDVVARRWLVDRRCAGCRHGGRELRADGAGPCQRCGDRPATGTDPDGLPVCRACAAESAEDDPLVPDGAGGGVLCDICEEALANGITADGRDACRDCGRALDDQDDDDASSPPVALPDGGRDPLAPVELRIQTRRVHLAGIASMLQLGIEEAKRRGIAHGPGAATIQAVVDGIEDSYPRDQRVEDMLDFDRFLEGEPLGAPEDEVDVGLDAVDELDVDDEPGHDFDAYCLMLGQETLDDLANGGLWHKEADDGALLILAHEDNEELVRGALAEADGEVVE